MLLKGKYNIIYLIVRFLYFKIKNIVIYLSVFFFSSWRSFGYICIYSYLFLFEKL